MTPYINSIKGAQPPRFPMIPDKLWRISNCSAAEEAYLALVLKWRTSLISWLHSAEGRSHLSRGLIDILCSTLGTGREKTEFSPYKLEKFPGTLLAGPQSSLKGASRRRQILNLLVWRAYIIDFLADVWDTLGSATFSMEECRVATDLFMPQGKIVSSHCVFCLCELPAEDVVSNHHIFSCPVQTQMQRPSWGGDSSDEEGLP